MQKAKNKTRVLVIGGRGYIGSHVAKHLRQLGAQVIIGTRGYKRPLLDSERQIVFHQDKGASTWLNNIRDVDIVVNAVGILRQRFGESFQSVHHHAPAELAKACQTRGTRLIHISSLGLENNTSSRFIRSKLDGEAAIKSSGADWNIVRPSIADGAGGFGAKWFRRIAAWPIHAIPTNALGYLAPINIDDVGEAIARIALKKPIHCVHNEREFELGGDQLFTLFDYLETLAEKPAFLKLRIPSFMARLTAHLCDLLHVTPYSFGHYEMLKYNNIPRRNHLTELLHRPATKIGVTHEPQTNSAPILLDSGTA